MWPVRDQVSDQHRHGGHGPRQQPRAVFAHFYPRSERGTGSAGKGRSKGTSRWAWAARSNGSTWRERRTRQTWATRTSGIRRSCRCDQRGHLQHRAQDRLLRRAEKTARGLRAPQVRRRGDQLRKPLRSDHREVHVLHSRDLFLHLPRPDARRGRHQHVGWSVQEQPGNAAVKTNHTADWAKQLFLIVVWHHYQQMCVCTFTIMKQRQSLRADVGTAVPAGLSIREAAWREALSHGQWSCLNFTDTEQSLKLAWAVCRPAVWAEFPRTALLQRLADASWLSHIWSSLDLVSPELLSNFINSEQEYKYFLFLWSHRVQMWKSFLSQQSQQTHFLVS